MTGESFELAQVNIGRMSAPLDSPRMAGFVAALEPVNAVADRAPGFVWRLQDDAGDATSLRIFDDEWLLVNMSTWTSHDALMAYVYGPEHIAVLRERRQYFEKPVEAMTTLWWVPSGHRPTVPEAQERLIHLRAHGPTPYAFTLRSTFPAGLPDVDLAGRGAD